MHTLDVSVVALQGLMMQMNGIVKSVEMVLMDE